MSEKLTGWKAKEWETWSSRTCSGCTLDAWPCLEHAVPFCVTSLTNTAHIQKAAIISKQGQHEESSAGRGSVAPLLVFVLPVPSTHSRRPFCLKADDEGPPLRRARNSACFFILRALVGVIMVAR